MSSAIASRVAAFEKNIDISEHSSSKCFITNLASNNSNHRSTTTTTTPQQAAKSPPRRASTAADRSTGSMPEHAPVLSPRRATIGAGPTTNHVESKDLCNRMLTSWCDGEHKAGSEFPALDEDSTTDRFNDSTTVSQHRLSITSHTEDNSSKRGSLVSIASHLAAEGTGTRGSRRSSLVSIGTYRETNEEHSISTASDDDDSWGEGAEEEED